MAGYKSYRILVCFLISVVRLVAQDGSLDSSFNGTGILPIPQHSYGQIKLQTDGKIILAGIDSLYRYNADGTPDLSFGVNGADIILAGSVAISITCIAVQPDNKIIVFGVTNSIDPLYDKHYIICRRLADGKPDNSLNGNGFAIVPLGNDSTTYGGLILQPDNKILLTGGETYQTRFIITRINANGTIDAAFGTGGTVYTSFGERAYLSTMTVQPDGKIIAVGASSANYLGYNADSLAMARYNSDGSLDKSFNGSGKLTYAPLHDRFIQPGARGHAVVVQPDGKIVVGGIYCYGQSHGIWVNMDAAVWRFNQDGSADNSFNLTGLQTIAFGFNSPQGNNTVIDIGLQCDGKIVIGGQMDIFDFLKPNIALSRFNQNGSIDNTFGTAGVSLIRLTGAYGYDINTNTEAMALFHNRIYILGSSFYPYIPSLFAFKQSANFDSSSIRVANTCHGDTTSFAITGVTPDSVKWDFGDGYVSNMLSSTVITKHLYTNKGSYRVSCLIYTKCWTNQVYKTILIAGPGDLQLGNDTSFCEGSHLTLHSPISGQSYLWSTGDVTDSIVVSQTGNYSLSVNSNGCIIMDTILVTVTNNPVLYLGNDTTLCTGTTITLVVELPFSTILWDDNSTLPERTVSKAGRYSVSVSLKGCSMADTIVIAEQSVPHFSLGADTSLCYGVPVTLHPAVLADRLLWEDGSVTLSRTIAAAGLYRLTAYNTCGSFSDEVRIDYHLCETLMPSAFTPNQDGLNDEFRFKNPAAVSNFSLQVYNRLGQLLFTTSNTGKGWDGTWHGIKQATGTYVWKMQYKNATGEANNFKGTVLLIR
jgi:gliding motility-associated-like protein/uncharacterized delta-60 repeat protein